jgi:uncharacterized Zn-binding protein involved in type VI secretion
MPQPAARQNDPVTGTDTHILMVPSPGGPVPTPTPLVNGKPLARVGDQVATCHDPADLPTGTITAGSADVLVV